MRITIRLLAALVLFAAPAAAEVAETYEIEAGRLTGLGSNVAIDITAHGTDSVGVWLATGRGISYSFDDGDSWYVYNRLHGLPAENLSAIFSVGGRIWVASNHNELIQSQLMTLSDGLTYSDDNGESWTTLDFGSTGLNIPYVIGGDRTIFDITGHKDVGFLNHRTNDTTDWLFASAFAGGLLASQDGGLHWRRIYASRADSIQYSYTYEAPSLRNRYFSCVADTSHGDSLFLWAGTAAGIFQYVYAPPRNKLYSHWINCLAFCDSCSSGAGSRLFIGGESGLSLGSADGGSIATRFVIDGLPEQGSNVVSVFSIDDVLLAGTVNPLTDSSTGMVISTDGGESFSEVAGQPWPLDDQSVISDFAAMNGRVYAAVQAAGLYVSIDLGTNWVPVPLDTLYSSAALQTVHAVHAAGDTLFVGTDSGLIQLTLDGTGIITASTHVAFVDGTDTGARVIAVKHQVWQDRFLHDNSILWTINRPVSSGGVAMIGRFGPVTSDTTYVVVGYDPPDTVDWVFDTTGFSWNYFRLGIDIYDVNFFSDTVFGVGENGIWFSPRIGELTNFFSARQYYNDTLVVDYLDQDTVTAMEVRGDTVVFGCSDGVAISKNRGQSFTIYRANTDTLSPDFVVNHTYLSSLGGLAGDFIPALAVQYRQDSTARVWVGARPAEMGGQGISYGEHDTAGIMKWHTVYEDDFAWNFEFMGDTILAATNLGLLLNSGELGDLDSTFWDTVALTDAGSGETMVAVGTAAYGVSLAGPYLWVGTDDGTVRITRNDPADQRLFQRVDSTTAADEVYAFPVPFRPLEGQAVDFHFVVAEAGNVTVEIYDFAMNLVATPINNVYFGAGIYPSQGSQGITWDGYNDKGDLVAVGVYYFKVKFGSGDTRWGKLAVIP